MKENDRPSSDPREAERIDAWLRHGLQPENGTVERLVRRSLRADGSARPRGRRLAIATAAFTIVLAAAAMMLFPRTGERDDRTNITRTTARVKILTITNESGVVEVLYPSTAANPPGDGPAHPSGRPREISIFNSGGLVAATVPLPLDHHFILGGES